MTFWSEVIHREIHRPHWVACGKLVRTGRRPRVFPRFRTDAAALRVLAKATHQTAQPAKRDIQETAGSSGASAEDQLSFVCVFDHGGRNRPHRGRN